ncbi:MAG: DVUA0089 family protein [Synechococcales bacterium]|nr:DVUA0089 family protein [Synechococcales bacterium]
MVQVSLTTSTTFDGDLNALVEDQGTALTIRVDLDEPAPAGGLRVYVDSDVEQILNRLDLPGFAFNPSLENIDVSTFSGNLDNSGFAVTIDEGATFGSFTIDIFDNPEPDTFLPETFDGLVETTFSLLTADQIAPEDQSSITGVSDYTIDADAATSTVLFADDASQLPGEPEPPTPPTSGYDEAVGGDISDDPASPLELPLSEGTTQLSATSGGGDQEYVTVTVPDGFQLDSLVLESYSAGSDVAFIGVQEGSTFTEPLDESADTSNILGYALFGQGQASTDILDNIGNGSGAIGFDGPLPSGTYTFALQQLGANSDYTLAFNVSEATSIEPPPAELPVVSFEAIPATISEEGSAEERLLRLVFTVDGTIPEDGLVVNFDNLFGITDQMDGADDRGAFNNLGFAGFDRENNRILVRLDANEASMELPIINDLVEETTTFDFRLAEGEGYTIDPDQNATLFTITDDNGGPGVGPTIGLSVSETNLAEGDPLTVNFTVDGDIPAEGIEVLVESPVGAALGQFDLADLSALELSGISDVRVGDTRGSSFIATITEPNASITLSVFDDIVADEVLELPFALANGELYEVDPDAAGVTLTISDEPSEAGPTVGIALDKTDVTEGESITLTFTVEGEIPADGLTILVNDVNSAQNGFRSLTEFDIANVELSSGIDSFPTPAEGDSGFFVTLTESTATITLPVLDDGADEDEANESFTFEVIDGEAYEVDADAGSVTLSISDADDGGGGGGDAPTISLFTLGGTFDEDTLITPNLVEDPEAGTPVLSISLSADGPIPEGGIVVNVNSDLTDITQFVAQAGPAPLSFGGEVIGAIYDEDGVATGFRFRLDQPNAVINFPGVGLEAEGPQAVTFFVAEGDGYTADEANGSSTLTVYDSLDQVPELTAVPEVSLSVSDAGPLEEGISETTLTFTVTGDIPPEGVVVYVDSGVRAGVGEFDLFNASIEGGGFPAPDGSAGGFFFKITEPTASITLTPSADELVEGIETLTFSLQEAPGYTIAADAGSATIAIQDDASSLVQVSLTTEPAVLVESEETVSVHTFSLSSPPPAEGITVSVSAPSLGEFNLDGIEITGGAIAAVRDDGFDFTITEPTATINLPVANDGEAERLETAVFTLVAGDGYQINPEAGEGSFAIADTPADAPPAPITDTESNDTIATAVATGLSADSPTVTVDGAIAFTFRGNREVDQTEDVDLYSFDLAAGDTIRVDIDAEQLGSELDSVVRLFDADGNALAQSDDDFAPDEVFAAGRDSYLEYTAETAGTYYVGVSSFPNGEFDFDNNPYEPSMAGSGTGRSSGTYTLNLLLNQEIVPDPTVIIPGTGAGPTVSLSATPGTYDGDDNLLANALVQSIESGASILTLGLTVDGTIPEEGLEVVLTSDIDLSTLFETGGLFSPGTEVLGAAYDETGAPVGLRLLLTERNAIVNLNVENLETPATDGPDPITFTLEPGAGYVVGDETFSTTVYDTLADVPALPTVPEVSLAISETALVESEGNPTTLTFTLSEAPPEDGVLVYVDSGMRAALGEFDVLNAEITGGSIPAPNFQSSGFYFRITEQTASITLSAFDETTIPDLDPEAAVEGIEEFTFTVQPGVGYAIAPDAGAVTLTIADNPNSVPLPDDGGDGDGDTNPTETELNDTIADANLIELPTDGSSVVIDGAIGTTRATRNLIDASEDVDMYAFELEAGQTLVLDVDASGTGDAGIEGSLLDSVLRIFDADGNELANIGNAPASNEVFQAGGDPYIEFTAPAAGTYYAAISNLGNDFYDPNVAGSGSGWTFPDRFEPGPYRLEASLADSHSGDGPVVSFSTTPEIISEAEGTALVLNFSVEGEIPEGGITVNLEGDTAEILQQFLAPDGDGAVQTRVTEEGNLLYRFDTSFEPDNENFGNVVGGILDVFTLEDGDPAEDNSDPAAAGTGFLSNFSFTITDPTASITLPVADDLVEEADQTFTYTLVEGKGYEVDATANSGTFTVTDGVTPATSPTVGVTAAPATLIESEQTVIEVTFTTEGDIPEEGVVVQLQGPPRAIAEFDVNSTNPRLPEEETVVEGVVIEGGSIVGTDEVAGSLFLRITEPTATLTVPVFQDGVAEGIEVLPFTLIDGENYEVDPAASEVIVTIEDAPAEDILTLESGVTSVFLDLPLLESAAGLTLVSVDSGAEPFSDDFQVGFTITEETDFSFTTDPFAPVGGTIEHAGTLTFDLGGAEATLGEFSIGFDFRRVSETTSGFFVADTLEDPLGLEILFDLSAPGTAAVMNDEFEISGTDVLLAPELATALGLPDLAGTDVGDARVDALVSLADGGGGNGGLIEGTEGTDDLIGTDSNDLLDGLQGDDLYTGGAGADQFVFSIAQGIDTITDFEVGTDQISLGGLTPDGVKLFELSSDTLVLTNSNELLGVVQGVTGLDSSVFA